MHLLRAVGSGVGDRGRRAIVDGVRGSIRSGVGLGEDHRVGFLVDIPDAGGRDSTGQRGLIVRGAGAGRGGLFVAFLGRVEGLLLVCRLPRKHRGEGFECGRRKFVFGGWCATKLD